jgi:hypothetical protein
MLGIHDEYGNAQLQEIIHHKNKKIKLVLHSIYIFIYMFTECSPVWTWIGPYFTICVWGLLAEAS